jgi:hypothetical protein
LISIAEYDSKFSDMTVSVSKSEAASVLSKAKSDLGLDKSNHIINPTPKKGGTLYNKIPDSSTKKNDDPLKILLG